VNDNSSSADKSPSPAEKTIESVGPAQVSPTLHVHVICGGIEEAGNYLPPNEGWPAVDAIAVGHYLNVEPQFAELALDNAISGRPPSTVAADDGSVSANILTDFTRRGIIQGKLGVPFFLPDPRDSKRIIVIAGMGSVGYFAEPQLTFLVLQLFSALARLGRKHLASVLIGSGTGSLGTEVAVARWMRGVARAMAGGSTLTPVGYLTFIEHNAGKAEAIRTALTRYKSPPDGPGLSISVSPTSPIPPPPPGSSKATICTRQNTLQPVTLISVEQRGKKHCFGALSNQASHPQDFTTLKPDTISNANDELAARETEDPQREAAKFLFNLLVPQSFWGEFERKDPIVVECDSLTARLHWEMMVIPNLERDLGGDGFEFLGIYPTITRQFRNSFGQLPERPPRFDRTLRVLIVADTAEKMPVPASRDEAKAIQGIFERYGEFLRSSGSDRRVSVESLVGPEIANYKNVLDHLFQCPYDIVHFTGHCDYVKEDPADSGWVFSKGKKISAYELTRVDRVPEFVFSNGCSTGVTPPKVTSVSRRAVPSFAEAFFQRGVKNFICTAWPIASNPARDFACTFYKVMLGGESGRLRFMYEAMREARQSIRSTPAGARTWGAYQHYGNPWHRVG
jgi:CHAT domain